MASTTETVKSASSPYPTFYVLKAIQFISSVFVGGTWSYLFYQLNKDQRDVLGTFFFVSSLRPRQQTVQLTRTQLAAIAFLSILIVTVTTCVCLFSGPQPSFGMVILSLILFAMWVGNVTALSHHMSGTLASPCDLVHFNGSTGIAICKLYKALFGINIVAL